jgi:serine/threonine protein kinase/tetratricopeptide (TPR) repeat protein
MIGRTIGHYRILSKIGEGGMGEVFLAEDTTLDRRIALKILSHPRPEDHQLRRFEREAKAAAALNHPNIVSVYDFGQEGGMPYLVMELLEGNNLKDLLNAGAMSARVALAYSREIAQGVAAAHNNGVCHRDLKPANIFVTADNRVKILDFGVAALRKPRIIDGQVEGQVATQEFLTSPGEMLGTVGYMSPEQVRGEASDYRSDIFSLGAVFYEMFSGQRAFKEDVAVETLHSILNKEPSASALDDAGIPFPLAQIIFRCLKKQPTERFQSARDLAFALQALSLQESAEAGGAARAGIDTASSLYRSLGTKWSVAVLPLVNMSPDPDTEYFSDGVTDDIISVLAHMKELRVAARTSSFAFKGKTQSIAEVGAKLRVDAVLEGSVRRMGKRLRINVRLVNVADGYHLWSERYDREMDDVFTIQDDIANNVARKLQLTLTGGAQEPRVKPGTEDLEAYDLYLKGRYLAEQRGEGLTKALEFFNRAIGVDPQYGAAYAATSEILSLLVIYGAGHPKELMPKAKVTATRALELDDSLAEAHNAMALVSLLYDRDWKRTEQEFDRALEINPNYVPSRYWKGLLYLLFVKGAHQEALNETLHAVVLDPIATIPLYALGLVMVALKRHEDAVSRARNGLKRDPTSFLLYRVLGMAYIGQGRYSEAIEALKLGSALSQRHPWLITELGVAYVGAGNPAEAEKLQDEIVARSKNVFVSPTTLSVIPIALGRLDEAARYWEQAMEENDPMLIAGAVWPTIVPAHKDPRIQKILDRLGLAWQK